MNISKWIITVFDDNKINLLFRWLLLLSIGFIPLWHIGELINILTLPRGHFYSQAAIHTPWSLVIIKNLFVPAMVFISFLIRYTRPNRLSYNEIIALSSLTAILIIAVLTTSDMDIWQFLVGVRWFLPFFLFIIIIFIYDKDLVMQLAYVSFGIMVINLMMQLWQIGNIPTVRWGYWGKIGETYLSNRNPGFFPLPVSAAMFICFSTLFLFHVVKSFKMRISLGVFCLLSVFLTMSGTGFCVALIILGTLLAGNYWRILLPVIVPTSYVLTKVIISFFRGSHYFGKSLGTRVSEFSNTMEDGKTELSGSFDLSVLIDWLFSANFGLGTNGAILLYNNLGIDITAIATDSFLTQLVVNLGGFTLIIYLILMTVSTLLAYISGAKVTVLLLFAIGIFSVTATITETFPVFILVFVAIAYSIKNGDFLFKNRRFLE